MKKFSLLFALLAVLMIAGVAFSHQITADPYDSDAGGSTILVPVYSAGALDVGDVVVWAIDDSTAGTDDNDLWVETTTTADTAIVAGVVWPSAIAAGGTGSIAIYGMAECDLSAVGAPAMAPICTTTTAGAGDNCWGGAAIQDASNSYAITTVGGAGSAQVKCFVDPK